MQWQINLPQMGLRMLFTSRGHGQPIQVEMEGGKTPLHMEVSRHEAAEQIRKARRYPALRPRRLRE